MLEVAWSVGSVPLNCFETTLDPMLQLQLQSVDALEAAAQVKVNVSSLFVPCHVIRDPVHSAFRVRLQFLLESAQDFQGGSNFLIGHDFRLRYTVVGLAHVRSSSQIGSAMVYQLHKMHAQSG